MAVDVETRGSFRRGNPRPFLEGSYELQTGLVRNFDIGPDDRFVLVRRQFTSTPREIVVRQGWKASFPGQ